MALLVRVPDLDAAIEVANATPFGLGSHAWTTDPDEAARDAGDGSQPGGPVAEPVGARVATVVATASLVGALTGFFGVGGGFAVVPALVLALAVAWTLARSRHWTRNLLDFATVLKEAQKLGYAEADPTFDIEGVDAAHKVTLMSAIAFGIPVQFDKAYIEGITKLGAADIKYAEQLGYRIKLLGISRRVDKGIELRVHPSLVPAKRLIANVEGAMNAVVVHGDAVGTTLYYGKGAGSEPTASAVIADLVDITRLHTADPHHRVPHLAFQPGTLQDAMGELPVLPMSEVVTSYYLRLRVADQAGVLARVAAILADAGISLRSVFVYSTDTAAKVARAVEVDGIDPRHAQSHIARMDKARRRYQQFFTQTSFGDPREYDLCLNSGRLGYDACVNAILASADRSATDPGSDSAPA